MNSCSKGWLQQLKQQQNITWQAISGENSAINVKASDKLCKSAMPIIEQYHRTFFYMDEVMFYNAHPKRMLDITKSKTCHGGKAYKDRIACYCVAM
jgi:hypothetical protein